MLQRAMPSLSPLQRQMLGLPAPGSEYWTGRTIEAVGHRYHGMDLSPYMEALAKRLAQSGISRL